MAKTKISEFNANPALNTDIDSINIAEGCSPSGINDAIRELMSQLKDWQSGTSNDPYVVGSSGSLTLNQGTANGVAYLNGSKVVTSGSALTYNATTLQNSVSANAATALANVTNSNSGSSSRAVYSFNSDTASGNIGVVSSAWNVDALSTNETYLYGSNGIALYAPSSQVIRFLANGSEQMRLTSTGLGIGTSSPAAKLDVNGGANSDIRVTTSGSGYLQLGQFTNGAFIGTSSTDATAGVLRLGTGGTTRATIDTSGNLGLGVTPSAWNSDYKALNYGSAGLLYGRVGSQEVALGTNWYRNSAGSFLYSTTGFASYYAQVSSAHTWYTAPSGTAGNAITFSQAMTLDASGNLLVGTTSNSYGNKLRIACATGADGAIETAVTQTTNSYQIRFVNGNGLVGAILTNGSATAYNTSSDYRLKNTIAPMTGALAKVALLKPCTYKWNVDGSDGEGFIAHELAEVVPQCVTGAKDVVDEDGNPQYQGIDTSFLVATLTAAIQELKAEFDAYKASHP